MQLAYNLPGPVPTLRPQPLKLVHQVWEQQDWCSWGPEQTLRLFPHLGALPPCHRCHYPVIVMHHIFSNYTETVAVHVCMTKAVSGAIEFILWYI